MVAESIELQYKISLDIHGMSDCRIGPLSIRDRLELFLEYRLAWRTGQGKRTVITYHPYAADRADWQFQVIDGVAVLMNGDKLTVRWLPSRTDDGRCISYDKVHALPGCWAIDPSQDLIIYVYTDIIEGEDVLSVASHTLSGNTAHPSAARPSMAYPGGNDRCPDQIDILENIVTFSSKQRLDVLLFDWKTGKILAVRASSLARSMLLMLTKLLETRTRAALGRYCKLFSLFPQNPLRSI